MMQEDNSQKIILRRHFFVYFFKKFLHIVFYQVCWRRNMIGMIDFYFCDSIFSWSFISFSSGIRKMESLGHYFMKFTYKMSIQNKSIILFPKGTLFIDKLYCLLDILYFSRRIIRVCVSIYFCFYIVSNRGIIPLDACRTHTFEHL